MPFLFILAMGLAGIAAALAALSSTHGEYFFAYQQIVQILFLTLSTVYYPITLVENYLPSFMISVVSGNPLSLAAEAMRNYAFAGHPIQPFFLVNILLTSIPFAVIGGLAYFASLHMLRVKGKL
jgi:ABC-type polysaccharide/polyol phosphate export permease